MFIVRIRGGLGNQLFIYAFCEYLKKFSDNIYVDGSEYKTFQCHDGLEVDQIFDISFPYASNRDIMKLSNYIPIPFSGKIGIGLFELEMLRERYWCRNHQKKSHILERDLMTGGMENMEEFLLSNRDKDLYFSGYWSDVRILDQIDENWLAFRPDFISKYLKYTENINFDMACSIHVRKGDIDGTSIDVCDAIYYKKAIDYIRKIRPSVDFLVFSDEIDKARKIITNDLNANVRFIDSSDENTAGVDIYLMSLCRDNIIANSSYSYWGSRLNHHRDKCVIIPKQYSRMSYSNAIVI